MSIAYPGGLFYRRVLFFLHSAHAAPCNKHKSGELDRRPSGRRIEIVEPEVPASIAIRR